MYFEKFARELVGLAKMGLKVLRNSVYADGGVMAMSMSSDFLLASTGLAESRHV